MSTAARAAALYAAIRLVRPLHRHVHRVVELGLAAEGISVPMRAVLEALHEGGPATVPQVARALAIRRQFIQRTADELLARGLVEHAANPAHRRSRLVRLTARGEALVRRVLAREAGELRDLAAPLSVAEIETFRAVMVYLTETLARRAATGPDPDAHGAAAARRGARAGRTAARRRRTT